jgi:hypothetical protein
VIQVAFIQISPKSVFSNPAHINPLAKTDRQTAVAHINQTAQAAVDKTKTDTVTISPQALKMNSRIYNPAKESREDAAERTAQKDSGQR